MMRALVACRALWALDRIFNVSGIADGLNAALIVANEDADVASSVLLLVPKVINNNAKTRAQLASNGVALRIVTVMSAHNRTSKLVAASGCAALKSIVDETTVAALSQAEALHGAHEQH